MTENKMTNRIDLTEVSHVELPCQFSGQVLAIGGEHRNRFCLGRDNHFYISPSIGDMNNLNTVHALEDAIEAMKRDLDIQPELVVCDLNQGFMTTSVAKEMGLPLLQVQHHYAHVLSCMAENAETGPVLGVTFDHSGYGTDGTIWGGEFLLADLHGYKRVGSVLPFNQIGGDASAKEGWRIALPMIHALYGESGAEKCEALGLCDAQTARIYGKMGKLGINSERSSSTGRLFEAVSAIIGICKSSDYHWQAFIELENAAAGFESRYLKGELSQDEAEKIDALLKKKRFAPGRTHDRMLIPTDHLVMEIIRLRLEGASSDLLAYYFHRAMARQVVSGCEKLSVETKVSTIVLTGGVFSNKLFLRLCKEGLKEVGLLPLCHKNLPSGDESVALGQALAGMVQLSKQ